MSPQPTWRQQLTSTLAGPLALFGIVVLFYWKLVLTDQYTWLDTPGIASQILPWLQFQAGEWHAGRIPLWDPNSWFGQPLFGLGQPGSANPLNWLLLLVPLKNGWLRQGVLHWYFVSIHYLAALNAYALCRSLNRSRKASVVGGCVYALGGFAGSTEFPHILNSAAWTPLVFLFLLRAERGEKPWSSALLSGFFLGFGWLAGDLQTNLFVTLAAVGLWAWIFFREKRMAKLAAASVVIAFLASAFQTLPMAEYGRLSVSQNIAVDLTDSTTDSSPDVGATAAALALLGLALAWRTRQVRWLAAVGLGGLVCALGGNGLFHGALLLSIGLAPLSTFAIDLLPEAGASLWPKRVGFALAAIALVILGLAVIGFLSKVPALENRILLTALAAALAASILTGWRMQIVSARLGAAALLALILFEFASVTTYFLPNRNIPEKNQYLHQMREHSDLINYIRYLGNGSRVQYADDISYNLGDWYGIETVNTRTPSVLENVWNMRALSQRGQDFFGVRYYLGKKSANSSQVEVFQGKSGVKVFENSTAYPRAWSVHEVKTVANITQARQTFNSPAFDLKSAAILMSTAPALESCDSDDDNVEVPIHRPNYVHLKAHMTCRGMVILTDSWFPGWRATVDGAPTPILEVDGGVRGIVLDRGTHEIDMKYRPWSVFLGGAMTLFAAALVVWACGKDFAILSSVRNLVQSQNSSDARPMGTQASALWTVAGLAIVLAYFAWFAIPAYFTPLFTGDDTANLYHYWAEGWRALIRGAVIFWSTSYRPSGGVFYLGLFDLFGFHPLPFRLVSLAILCANTILMYFLTWKISQSRWVAFVASFLLAFRPDRTDVFFSTGGIFDVLAMFFYLLTLLVYVTRRESGWKWSLAVVALAVCALDSKEMAATLPLALAAYDLCCVAPKPGQWWRRLSTVTWIVAAMTVAYTLGKLHGPDSLITMEAYRPVLSWHRFTENSLAYTNALLLTHWFTSPLRLIGFWIVGSAAVFALAPRYIRWAWCCILFLPLPIAFIPLRGGCSLYLLELGWAILTAAIVAGLPEQLAARLAWKPHWRIAIPAVFVAVFCLIIGSAWKTMFNSSVPLWVPDQAATTDSIHALQSALPSVPHHSRVLFLNDPFGDKWDMKFIAALQFNDPSVEVMLKREISSQQDVNQFDYVCQSQDRLMHCTMPRH